METDTTRGSQERTGPSMASGWTSLPAELQHKIMGHVFCDQTITPRDMPHPCLFVSRSFHLLAVEALHRHATLQIGRYTGGEGRLFRPKGPFNKHLQTLKINITLEHGDEGFAWLRNVHSDLHGLEQLENVEILVEAQYGAASYNRQSPPGDAMEFCTKRLKVTVLHSNGGPRAAVSYRNNVNRFVFRLLTIARTDETVEPEEDWDKTHPFIWRVSTV